VSNFRSDTSGRTAAKTSDFLSRPGLAPRIHPE
jgi:hypothetical protein